MLYTEDHKQIDFSLEFVKLFPLAPKISVIPSIINVIVELNEENKFLDLGTLKRKEENQRMRTEMENSMIKDIHHFQIPGSSYFLEKKPIMKRRRKR